MSNVILGGILSAATAALFARIWISAAKKSEREYAEAFVVIGRFIYYGSLGMVALGVLMLIIRLL